MDNWPNVNQPNTILIAFSPSSAFSVFYNIDIFLKTMVSLSPSLSLNRCFLIRVWPDFFMVILRLCIFKQDTSLATCVLLNEWHLEAHDIHVPVASDDSFNHLVKELSEFCTKRTVTVLYLKTDDQPISREMLKTMWSLVPFENYLLDLESIDDFCLSQSLLW